ncbi:MAG: DUF202 domain-containing protein [Flavobacteriales bacterium]|nr:DUF202 domain-containing protein [Flavobacteriales bacterium]
MNKFNEISRSDLLAIERTRLANERTFLAYFRTFIVFLSSGFAIFKIEIFSSLKSLGYFFIGVSFALLIMGIARFLYVKRQIKKSYY